MNISSIYGMGAEQYSYMDNHSKKAYAGGIGALAQNAEEKRSTSPGSGSSLWEGDMTVSQPPDYRGFTYDSSISGKTKEEMTMEEYKQWFMNEMSKMPVSGWYRSTCVGGSLTITEKAFEEMKSNPEWESTVMGMVRKMYSTNGIMGSKMIGFQVIGASPEECYGEGIPVNSGTDSGSLMNDGKSWWEKRHERLEKLLEEQTNEALKKVLERRASTAYESMISTFSEGTKEMKNF